MLFEELDLIILWVQLLSFYRDTWLPLLLKDLFPKYENKWIAVSRLPLSVTVPLKSLPRLKVRTMELEAWYSKLKVYRVVVESRSLLIGYRPINSPDMDSFLPLWKISRPPKSKKRLSSVRRLFPDRYNWFGLPINRATPRILEAFGLFAPLNVQPPVSQAPILLNYNPLRQQSVNAVVI